MQLLPEKAWQREWRGDGLNEMIRMKEGGQEGKTAKFDIFSKVVRARNFVNVMA